MNLLINPFERIAGWKALSIGFCFMALTAVFGKINHLFFNSVLYVSFFYAHSYAQAFLAQAVNWGVLVLVMWIAGIIFSKSKIRLIDVAGTMALSLAPLLLIVLTGFLPFFPKSVTELDKILIFSLLCIIPMIWMIALMYKAYSVSCNLSGTRGILSFIGALIVTLALSFVIFFTINFGSPINSRGAQTEIVIHRDQTINQTAAIVIEALKKSDFKTIRSYFDDTMKNRLSEMQLRMIWMTHTQKLGKLTDADTNVSAQHGEKYSLILIPCTFTNGKINLQLAFNSEGRISGLYIK